MFPLIPILLLLLMPASATPSGDIAWGTQPWVTWRLAAPDAGPATIELVEWLTADRPRRKPRPVVADETPTRNLRVAHRPVDSQTCDGHMACRRTRDGPR